MPPCTPAVRASVQGTLTPATNRSLTTTTHPLIAPFHFKRLTTYLHTRTKLTSSIFHLNIHQIIFTFYYILIRTPKRSLAQLLTTHSGLTYYPKLLYIPTYYSKLSPYMTPNLFLDAQIYFHIIQNYLKTICSGSKWSKIFWFSKNVFRIIRIRLGIIIFRFNRICQKKILVFFRGIRKSLDL